MDLLRHKQICDLLNKTAIEKNQKYGNSFERAYDKYGKISALTQLYHKFNRIETLMLNKNLDNDSGDSLIDALWDFSNYAIMTSIKLEEELQQQEDRDELPF